MTAAETRLDRQYTWRIFAIVGALFGVALVFGGRKTMERLPDDGALVLGAGVVALVAAVVVFVVEWCHALYESEDGLRLHRLTPTGWRESAVRYADVDDVRIQLSRKHKGGVGHQLGLVGLAVEAAVAAMNPRADILNDRTFFVDVDVGTRAGVVSFGRHTVEPVALLRRVQAATWQQRFAPRASRLQNHGTVEFGPVSLHADHVLVNESKLPRAGMTLSLEDGRLVVRAQGVFFAKKVRQGDVPNLDVLLALCGIDVLAPPNATTKAETTTTTTP